MIKTTVSNVQSNSAEREHAVKKSIKLIVALFFLVLFPLTSLAASITFDFRKLYTEEAREDLTGADLLKYLNSEELSPGLVQAIPYCSQAYGYSNGLKNERAYEEATSTLTDYGAIFICATDPETKEDTGGLTIQINPKCRHKINKIIASVYLDIMSTSDNNFAPQLEISINGEAFQKCEHTKRKPNYTANFSLQLDDVIVKDFTIRIPNVHRKKDGSIVDNDLEYYMAFTHINLIYNEETPEKVTDWRFAETSHTAYLNDEKPYVMPAFTAIPSAAADMMELSSSSPEVADIEDGKVVLKGDGVATITATLPENVLFTPGDTYSPATYELTVKSSMSTAIELVEADNEPEITNLYDLQGRRIRGKPSAGIYILKSQSTAKKVIIR